MYSAKSSILLGIMCTPGHGEYRTLGSLSASALRSALQAAPSRNIPKQYTPSSGFFSAYSASSPFKIAKSKSTLSISILCLRAKFCFEPVRNACVKKNAYSGKVLGTPSFTHFWKNAHRSTSSLK